MGAHWGDAFVVLFLYGIAAAMLCTMAVVGGGQNDVDTPYQDDNEREN